MQIPEFTLQHSQQLSAFLASRKGAMTLPQSQGYLFAIICSPEPLDVHEWLEQIIPDIQGQLEEQMLFSFMAMYHQISEQVYETGFKLPVSLQIGADNENYLDLHECQQWCLGFVHGSQSYVDKLMQAGSLSVELKEALQTAYASLGFFALEPEVIATIAQKNQLSDAQLSQQQYELMGDFALGFAELIEIIAVQSGLYTDEEDSWN
ncbi:hypothetical protein AMS58_20380 [Pseudoalteromonas porphyrae]|uniref:UPF0149 family protein n=1 Tax=Pseudoalteromonas porphyrae TaxID=187330 RepID=UPI0006BAEA1B|nr:UPF0149 family protein [Pseudoalteromonas porphyrae]KPH92867.1 hypothetical protein AMS58_20380 [Pseudoalteromonas porphyrae]